MSTELTDAEREALSQALRACRVEDGAPVRLIREGDIFHVTHMVGVAVEKILAERLAHIEALADEWGRIPDFNPTQYDQGRVDQRHMAATELLEALGH